MTIKRITFVQEMLKFMGLEGRLQLEWISSAEAQKFAEVVTGFTEKIRQLGPSPMADHLHIPMGPQSGSKGKNRILGKETHIHESQYAN
jgi:F420-non-reducing hydrogenase iron-sulfur subunit